LSRRAKQGDKEALLAEAAVRKRAEAYGFAETGVLNVLSERAPATGAGLRRAVVAMTKAVAGMGSSKPPKAHANNPEALFASSSFPPVSKAEFLARMAELEPELARERAAGAQGRFHKAVNVRATLERHVKGRLCPRCRDSEGGADECYIYGSLIQYINYSPVWNELGEPPKLDCGVLPVAPGAPAAACRKTIDTLRDMSIIEKTTLEEAHTIAPAFMVPRAEPLLNEEEKAAVAPDEYDVKLINSLAEKRARTVFGEMRRAAGPNKAYTRDVFAAAQLALRGAPKWRVVQAFDQAKVNEHTPDWDISMVSFSDDFLYNWTTDTRFFKKDLEKGFYAIRVASEFRKYFCFRDPLDPSVIWRFTRLPMGLKASPPLFSMMTGEFVQIVRATEFVREQGAAAGMYIDDFAGNSPAAVAQPYMDKVAELGAEIDLSFAPEKDSGPSAAEELLGLTYASNVDGAPMIRVAGKQMFSMLVSMHLLRICHLEEPGHVQVPAEFIKSLAGRASWVAQTTYAARLHIGSLWYCARMSPYAMVPVAHLVRNGLMADIDWFITSAAAGTLRGQRLVQNGALSAGKVERVSGDASGDKRQGAGATWRNEALHHVWEGSEGEMSIQAQELHPDVAAARAWGPRWRGKTVIFATDNLGNAIGINTAKAARGAARKLLAELYDLADKYDFELLAVWVPREYNVVCDALSKAGSLEEARAAAVAVGADGLRVSSY
jgi:hypothetical protein